MAGKKQTELQLNNSEEVNIGMAETNKHDKYVLDELAQIGGYSYTSFMFGVGIIPCLGRVKCYDVAQMHNKDIKDPRTLTAWEGGSKLWTIVCIGFYK